MTDEAAAYAGWAIVECFGHRRRGGCVSEVQQFGTTMLRIDVPGEELGSVDHTEYYGGASIYALTPCDEKTARYAAGVEKRSAPVVYQLGTPTRPTFDEDDEDELTEDEIEKLPF